ncbi:MAG: type II CRISPR-associated endonuclease Cas1 [Bacteroidaceae bacterium]|nr:type II CRISPR-associated endonuclease Cas1 [Bacteroidaceae bacterium]
MRQTLFLTSAVNVSVHNGLVEIVYQAEPDKKYYKSVDDIGAVIVDNHSVHLTVPVLNKFAENNVLVAFCGENHMPSSVLLDLNSHSLQTRNYRAQMKASEPLKKNIWKQIVEWKIRNQSLLLDLRLGTSNSLADYFLKVRSGDSSNREAIAAKVYWRRLLGRNFVRDRMGESPNNLLNYGYTLLRSWTARCILDAGLLPVLGVFHRSYTNSCPLADDVMEPYRPFVDRKALEMFSAGRTEVDKSVKAEFAELFYTDISYDTMTATTHSLAHIFLGESRLISYPLLG